MAARFARVGRLEMVWGSDPPGADRRTLSTGWLLEVNTSGGAIVEVGGERHALGDRAAYLIRPDTGFRVSAADGRTYASFRVPPDLFARIAGDRELPPLVVDPRCALAGWLPAVIGRHLDDPPMVESLLGGLITRLARSSAELAPPPAVGERAARMRELIERRSPERVSLDELGAVAGLSSGHAQRVFVEAFGLSPRELQVSLQIDRAKRLLARGRPASEVAASAGFFDQSHLHRTFRRHTGTTPGRYRRLCREHGDVGGLGEPGDAVGHLDDRPGAGR